MQEQSNLLKSESEYLLKTYKRIPIEIDRGEGVYLFDKDGKKYLDFFSGLAVNALGYGNKNVTEAIEKQLNKYIHLSNFYVSSPQVELARKLVELTGLSKVFFTNSGTEAVETSLKLIRKAFGPEKNIITFSGAFHGRTYGALSLSGREKYKKYFAPLLQNIIQLEFNNVGQLKQNLNDNTAAVYLEFIQGEGGINVVSNEFVEQLSNFRRKFDFAIIADEVQSGFGRTGKPFAYNHFNLKPDLLLIAKAMGGGLPLGALIVNERYSDTFEPGDHGSTFGGNPVACSAGLAVINEIVKNNLLKRVEELGNYFKSELESLEQSFTYLIKEIRGLGFMLGVELTRNCSDIISDFLRKGVLVNCTNENVIRILPPLITTKTEVDLFLRTFKEILIDIKQ